MASSSFRDLRPIAIPAYGPTFLGAVGTGAVVPVVALTARDLGGSVGVAAFVVALLGVGQLVGDLPAGALAARFGEKRALLLGAVLELLGGVGCLLAPNVAVLAGSVFVIGLAASVFNLARQSYLAAVVPVDLRARAMSTLGGVARIGMFIGPFIGAAAISWGGIKSAYIVDICAAVAAFALVLFTEDITATERGTEVHRDRVSVLRSMVANRKVLRTLGVGALILSGTRSCRTVIVPLWAASIGLNAAHASVIVGISAAVDMLLFYPGGSAMDRWGRLVVALPSSIVLGTGMIAIVFTDSFGSLAGIAMILGVGNGIGSGLIGTLGADVAPATGRPQFLAGWRLMADSGAAAGPLVMSAITTVFPLAAAGVAMGLVAYVGAGWLRIWVPRYDPVSASTLTRRRSVRGRTRA